MQNLWLSSSHPKCIAHRGAPALAPENTAAGFAAAIAAGAEAIESDVRVTLDGVLVSFHDADLARLAGDPRLVSTLTLEDLRGLVPGVMTLAQAIAASAPVGLLLDMKVSDASVLQGVASAVATAAAGDRVIVGLRSIAAAMMLRETAPDLTILAFAADPDSSAAWRAAGAAWIRLWEADVTAERVAAAQGNGLKVVIMVGGRTADIDPGLPPVGTIDPAGLDRLALLGADAIMLDDPWLMHR